MPWVGSSRQVKRVLLPEMQDNSSKGYNGTNFIGNTYQIYRTILHQFAKDKNWDNVYSSPALPSGNLGKIEIMDKLKITPYILNENAFEFMDFSEEGQEIFEYEDEEALFKIFKKGKEYEAICHISIKMLKELVPGDYWTPSNNTSEGKEVIVKSICLYDSETDEEVPLEETGLTEELIINSIDYI